MIQVRSNYNGRKVTMTMTLEEFDVLLIDAESWRMEMEAKIQKNPSCSITADALNASVHRRWKNKYRTLLLQIRRTVESYRSIVDNQRRRREQEELNNVFDS
jgi:hypothetical protein